MNNPKRVKSSSSEPSEKSVETGIDGSRVWASITQRVRTGKYETVELSMGASRTIGSDEEITSALRELAADVRKEEVELLNILREEEGV